MYGKADEEARQFLIGVMAGAADRFIAKGLTVEQVRFAKVEFSDHITREEIRQNPDKIYLFGDNLQQSGYGGQAKEMRGEPNAIGIPTKKAPSREDWAFFTDQDYEENKTAISSAFAKLAKYPASTTIVFPQAGLGTGLADLENRAPQTFAYLQKRLANVGIPVPGVATKAEQVISVAQDQQVTVNELPPIDIEAYQIAINEDYNYDESAENYTAAEVRSLYFDGVRRLAADLTRLTQETETRPTTEKGKKIWQKNLRELAENRDALAAHVNYTGRYFGDASETFIKEELHSRNIYVDEEYNVRLIRPEKGETDGQESSRSTA